MTNLSASKQGIDKLSWLLLTLMLIATAVLAYRFYFGLGAVSHLSNQFPWGLWVVLDVIIGSSIACGGLAVSLLIMLSGRSDYQRFLRPALLSSLCGYSLAGLSAVIDMGRYWQVLNIFNPSLQNWNSVMLEVSLCISAYCIILLLELSPLWLKRLGFPRLEYRLRRLMFVFIAIGLLLACLHQASLGSLLLLIDQRIMLLWQSGQALPLLTLTTALMTGFAIVVCARGTSSNQEQSLLFLRVRLLRISIILALVFVVIRVAELMINDKLTFVFTSQGYSQLLWLEISLFLLPSVLLLYHNKPILSQKLVTTAAVSLLLGNALYRFNAFMFAFNPDAVTRYWPSIGEWLITVGIFSLEIFLFRYLLKLDGKKYPLTLKAHD